MKAQRLTKRQPLQQGSSAFGHNYTSNNDVMNHMEKNTTNKVLGVQNASCQNILCAIN